jgi:hypothetical protein
LDEADGISRQFGRYYKRSPSPLDKPHTWKSLADSPIEKKEMTVATIAEKIADPAIAKMPHRDRLPSALQNLDRASKITPPKALQTPVEFPRRRLNGNIYHDRISKS